MSVQPVTVPCVDCGEPTLAHIGSDMPVEDVQVLCLVCYRARVVAAQQVEPPTRKVKRD
jgi:hypothetical protein